MLCCSSRPPTLGATTEDRPGVRRRDGREGRAARRPHSFHGSPSLGPPSSGPPAWDTDVGLLEWARGAVRSSSRSPPRRRATLSGGERTPGAGRPDRRCRLRVGFSPGTKADDNHTTRSKAMLPPRLEGAVFAAPVTVRDGDPLAVTVTVAGIPIPDISWYQGAREIRNSREFRVEDTGVSSTLFITAVTEAVSSRGLTVVARNRLGSDSRSLEIKIYRVLTRWRSQVMSESATCRTPDTYRRAGSRKTVRNVHSDASSTSLDTRRPASYHEDITYRRGSQSTDDILDEVFSFDRKSTFANNPGSASVSARGAEASKAVKDASPQYRSSMSKDLFTQVTRAPPLALPEVFDDDDGEVTPDQSPVLHKPPTLVQPSTSTRGHLPVPKTTIGMRGHQSRDTLEEPNGTMLKQRKGVESGAVTGVVPQIKSEKREPLLTNKQNWISEQKLKATLSQPVKSYILPQKTHLRNGVVKDTDSDQLKHQDQVDGDSLYSSDAGPRIRTVGSSRDKGKGSAGHQDYDSFLSGYRDGSRRKETPILVRERVEVPASSATVMTAGSRVQERVQESASAPITQPKQPDNADTGFSGYGPALTVSSPVAVKELSLEQGRDSLQLKDASFALLGLSGALVFLILAVIVTYVLSWWSSDDVN